MFQWGLVLVAATAIIFIGASANIPFFERTNYATSVQTREDFKTANTPDLSRSQAIADVKMFISENCTNGDEYLSGLPPFEATWRRQPWANDFHDRLTHEWTVRDPITNNFWRLYEDSGFIVSKFGTANTVLSDCANMADKHLEVK